MSTEGNLQRTPKSIFDLPYEVRIQIYESILINEAPYILPDDYYDRDNDPLDWEENVHPVHKYPLGFHKPFSYQNEQWQFRIDRRRYVEFRESVAPHCIPAICHVNHQLRLETISLFLQEKLYIGMEGMKYCIDALNEFSAMLPEDVVSHIRKLSVGVRANVDSKKSIAYGVLREEYEADPAAMWERTLVGYWPLRDISADGLPSFELSIVENTLRIKTHYALIRDHADMIHQQIQRYRSQKVGGKTLFRIAKWLRSRDAIDKYELDSWTGDRFSWQFEAEENEVFFHQREKLAGEFKGCYSPTKLFGHVVASVEVLKP
jgi:hypothetical protein